MLWSLVLWRYPQWRHPCTWLLKWAYGPVPVDQWPLEWNQLERDFFLFRLTCWILNQKAGHMAKKQVFKVELHGKKSHKGPCAPQKSKLILYFQMNIHFKLKYASHIHDSTNVFHLAEHLPLQFTRCLKYSRLGCRTVLTLQIINTLIEQTALWISNMDPGVIRAWGEEYGDQSSEQEIYWDWVLSHWFYVPGYLWGKEIQLLSCRQKLYFLSVSGSSLLWNCLHANNWLFLAEAICWLTVWILEHWDQLRKLMWRYMMDLDHAQNPPQMRAVCLGPVTVHRQSHGFYALTIKS